MSTDRDVFAEIIESNYDTAGAFYTEPIEPGRAQLVELFAELLGKMSSLDTEQDWSFLRKTCGDTMQAVGVAMSGEALLVATPALVITEDGPMPIDSEDRLIGIFQALTPDELLICSDLDFERDLVFTPTGEAALYVVLSDASVEIAADSTRIPLGEILVSLSNGTPELHHIRYR